MLSPGTKVEIPSDHMAWKEGDKYGEVMDRVVSNMPEGCLPIQLRSGRIFYHIKEADLKVIEDYPDVKPPVPEKPEEPEPTVDIWGNPLS